MFHHSSVPPAEYRGKEGDGSIWIFVEGVRFLLWYVTLSSCPDHVCLPPRNGVVSKVKGSWADYQICKIHYYYLVLLCWRACIYVRCHSVATITTPPSKWMVFNGTDILAHQTPQASNNPTSSIPFLYRYVNCHYWFSV